MKPGLSDILSARWLIYRQEIINYFPLFLSFVNGNPVSLEESTDLTAICKFNIQAASGIAFPSQLEDPGLPEDTIAVIPIQGVMYASKTQDLINNVHKAEANSAISAMLFLTNTPGGMVFLTDIAAETIKNSPLPSVAYVMNMAASAGMWLISATDKIIASSKLDRFGSIGVKTSFTDINGFLKEKLGITVYDLYATQSVKKDEEVRALLAGDQQPIINDLDYTNEIFHQAIRENLGIAANSEVFSGAMYNVPQALELELVHAVAPLEMALQEAYKLGIKSKMNSMINHL